MYTDEGIYFKFATNRELNDRILQEYPPNDQQRRICKRLGVPASLWSFYLFKKEIIYESLVIRTYFIEMIRPGEYRSRLYFNEELIENHDYSEYGDMNLTPEEKFFIYYLRDIARYRRDCFCFQDSFPSFYTLCLRRIIDPKGYCNRGAIERAWFPVLPKVLVSRIKIERELRKRRVSMPKYDPKRAHFFDTCYQLTDLFSELDARNFTKEFVIWFQNDPTVCERFRPDSPIRTVFFHFERIQNFSDTRYNFCLRCMKRCWELHYEKKLVLNRHYYLHDAAFSDQLNKVRNPRHWCSYCKRVPLFQILSPEEYVKQYGEGSTSKDEIFL